MTDNVILNRGANQTTALCQLIEKRTERKRLKINTSNSKLKNNIPKIPEAVVCNPETKSILLKLIYNSVNSLSENKCSDQTTLSNKPFSDHNLKNPCH